MDTSKTYIKMCDKAEEIQQTWHWQEGDFYAVDRVETYDLYVVTTPSPKGVNIWLPRQDQLQAMLVGHFVDSTPRKLVKALWDWIAETAPPSNYSMEQLWLAFVMKEKYSKHWEDEKWKL